MSRFVMIHWRELLLEGNAVRWGGKEGRKEQKPFIFLCQLSFATWVFIIANVKLFFHVKLSLPIQTT